MDVDGEKNMFDMGSSLYNLIRFRNMQRVMKNNDGKLVFAGHLKLKEVDGKMVQVPETAEERKKKFKHAEVFMDHMIKIYGDLR